MGTIMDVYQLVRDLIEEAKKEKNLEMVDQLIEIKLFLSEIQKPADNRTAICGFDVLVKNLILLV